MLDGKLIHIYAPVQPLALHRPLLSAEIKGIKLEAVYTTLFQLKTGNFMRFGRSFTLQLFST